MGMLKIGVKECLTRLHPFLTYYRRSIINYVHTFSLSDLVVLSG
jgi:hypothetical protein